MERLQNQIAFLLEVDELKAILAINEPIAQGSPALWGFVRQLIEDAAARGHIES